jgi:membrane dipeptidase
MNRRAEEKKERKMTTRRNFIKTGAGALTAFAALSGPFESVSEATGVSMGAQEGASFAEVYQRAIVMDTLVNDGPGFDARRALEAGMTAAVVDIPIFPRNFPNAVQALEKWNAAFAKPDSPYLKALNGAGLRTAKEQKKFGVILACQDAQILDASTASVNDYNIQNLKRFYELGLRVLQLTHNERNGLGDSFREKTNAGLSRLGEKVVANMNALNMLVDLSHCGDATTMEAIRLSKKPCAITHAGCRALCPTLRNKTDEQIRALAERGGVFGVFNMSLWLSTRPTTSVNDVLDHIDHAVKIAGVDHVSFGSDGPVLENTTPEDQYLKGMRGYYERNAGLPGAEWAPSHVIVRELNSPQRLYRLAEALTKRGYKADAVEKIIGGNFARLFQEVCG